MRLESKEHGHGAAVDGKGCGCEKCGVEKQLKEAQESERECEVHFRRPWSAHWPRRTQLTVLRVQWG